MSSINKKEVIDPFQKSKNAWEYSVKFVTSNGKYQHQMYKVVYSNSIRDTNTGYISNIHINNGACHSAMLKWNNQATRINSMVSELCCADGYEESVEASWAWISDPKESPWRDITKHGVETFRDKNNRPIAWGQKLWEVVEPINPDLYKNWCIATRSIGERDDRWRLWHKLVTKKGMSKVDAVFLAGIYTITDNGILAPSNLMSGAHWPFTQDKTTVRRPSGEYGYHERGFSFSKVSKGTPKYPDATSVPPVNGFWLEKDGGPLDIFINIPPTPIKTRFSSMNTLELDKVIDTFYKWKDQYVQE